MICAVINGPTFEEAYNQITKAVKDADLVELRFDHFISLDLLDLKTLRAQFSIPMIFTLRSIIQGGNYQKTEAERLNKIRLLATLKPEYLDLEFYTSLEFISEISEQHPEIKLILSYHNFEKTPENLDACYLEMQKIPVHYYKLAVTANNCLDALRFICWAKQSKPNLIPISMGLHGQLTRILGPILGSPFTYASVDDNNSILGQLSAKVLKEQYRYHSLNSNTKIYGLIGDPVSQSISDVTHNYIFGYLELNAIYVKIQVRSIELTEFLLLAKQIGFSGLSVTMPLKEHILPILNVENCDADGAVNTLIFEGEEIRGLNTDGIGALNAIEKQIKVKDKQIVIIGAGGSAKAIAMEAQRRGAKIAIVNRNKEKAKAIGASLQCIGAGLDNMPMVAKEGYDIIINCTPVPLPIQPEDILPNAIVMDIVTKPKHTEFLKEGRKKGCELIYGYQMFNEQALGQFKLWFGCERNVDAVKPIFERKVGEVLMHDK